MNIYSHEGLFLPNKYTRWYYNIIEKAQSQDRKKLKRDHPDFIYYEKHHILPKCIWPQYKNLRLHPWNGVLLNAKEHYICHALLCKMITSSNIFYYKILYAFNNLQYSSANQIRYTSKLYEYFRKELSKELSKKFKGKILSKKTPESIEKQRLTLLKRKYRWWNNGIEEIKSNLNPDENWKRGRLPVSDETRKKLSNNSRYKGCKGKEHPNYGKTQSTESNKKRSNKLKNRIMTKEHRDKISKAKKGIKPSKESIEKGIITKRKNGSFEKRFWWTDGFSELLQKEKPSDNWNRGRLKRPKKPSQLQD